MGRLTANALLEVWDDVRRRSPPDRCLYLLGRSLPSQPLHELAGYDLALRDWHLLRWRCELFGSRIEAHGECPHCGQPVEVEFDADTLLAEVPAVDAPFHVDQEGRRYRLPNSTDLIAAGRGRDTETAAAMLLAACSIDGTLPEDAGRRDAVEQALGELAAMRGLRLQLHCAGCSGTWVTGFDPGQFCWEELDAGANALLDEVHVLASAYGWSEPQILALSDARREAYLARVL